MNGYFAVALNKNDSKLVSTKATFPIVVSDHITLAYKPSKRIYNKYKKLVGHKVGAMIEGYRSNNAIDALWVGKMIDINTDKYIKRHDDGDAHITLSHNKVINKVTPIQCLLILQLIKERLVMLKVL